MGSFIIIIYGLWIFWLGVREEGLAPELMLSEVASITMALVLLQADETTDSLGTLLDANRARIK